MCASPGCFDSSLRPPARFVNLFSNVHREPMDAAVSEILPLAVGMFKIYQSSVRIVPIGNPFTVGKKSNSASSPLGLQEYFSYDSAEDHNWSIHST